MHFLKCQNREPTVPIDILLSSHFPTRPTYLQTIGVKKNTPHLHFHFFLTHLHFTIFQNSTPLSTRISYPSPYPRPISSKSHPHQKDAIPPNPSSTAREKTTQQKKKTKHPWRSKSRPPSLPHTHTPSSPPSLTPTPTPTPTNPITHTLPTPSIEPTSTIEPTTRQLRPRRKIGTYAEKEEAVIEIEEEEDTLMEDAPPPSTTATTVAAAAAGEG